MHIPARATKLNVGNCCSIKSRVSSRASSSYWDCPLWFAGTESCPLFAHGLGLPTGARSIQAASVLSPSMWKSPTQAFERTLWLFCTRRFRHQTSGTAGACSKCRSLKLRWSGVLSLVRAPRPTHSSNWTTATLNAKLVPPRILRSSDAQCKLTFWCMPIPEMLVPAHAKSPESVEKVFSKIEKSADGVPFCHLMPTRG